MIGAQRAAILEPKFKSVPVSFSRVGVAYDQQGNIVPANTPRFFSQSGKSGLLIEEFTTNMLTANQSNCGNTTGDTTGFVKYGSDTLLEITTNEHYIGNSCLKVTTTANIGRGVYLTSRTTTVGLPYTETVILKGSGTLQLRIVNQNETQIRATSGDIVLTDTWTEYSVTGTPDVGDTALQVTLRSKNAESCIIYVGRQQFEQKVYPTSWILGGTTRQNEVCKIPSNVLNIDNSGTTPNKGQGTIELDFYVNPSIKVTSSRSPYIFANLDGSSNNRIAIVIYYNNGTADNLTFALKDNVILTTTPQFTYQTLSEGWHKLAVRWDINSMILTIDGNIATQKVTTSPSLPTSYSNCYIGSNGGNQWDAPIRNICISKIKRTDTDIQNRATLKTYPIDKNVTFFALLENDLKGVASV